MQLVFEKIDDMLLCKLKGDFDVVSSNQIKNELSNKINTTDKNIIVLDFSENDYMDSSGIGVIVNIYKLSKSKGKEMIMVSLKDSIKNLFEMTNLTKIFSIYDNIDDFKKS